MSGFLRPSAGEVFVAGGPAWRRPGIYRQVGLVPSGRRSTRSSPASSSPASTPASRACPTRTRPPPGRWTWSTSARPGTVRSGPTRRACAQRAKVAGALVTEPPILLLDEPFNGMDSRQRLSMMELLRQMAAEGRTVLFSSHILEEVERLAEQVLVIVAGRLAASGDFRAIRKLMTDRPRTFTAQPTTGGWQPPCSGQPSIFGVEVSGGSLLVRSADFSAFSRAIAGVAQAAPTSACSRCSPDRQIARERLLLPGGAVSGRGTAAGPAAATGRGSVIVTIAALTARSLLGRRRSLLLVLLACLPIAAAVLVRCTGGS